jgi:vancomycin resistance protein YoaR
VKKFVVTVVLTAALIISWNFCAGATNKSAVAVSARDFEIGRKPARAYELQEPYFTIWVDKKPYHVTDETLAGGWWNVETQSAARAGADFWDMTAGDRMAVDALIARICREHECRANDGIVVFNAGEAEKFTVEGQKTGRGIDAAKLKRDVAAAIAAGARAKNDGENGGSWRDIHAVVRDTKPREPRDIVANLGLRSSYTTYFESNPNREHNIALALSKFNGLVIDKGQTVSFNSVVGKRSAERGFLEAKIILDGEFVAGIGGGVCQASTTIFNAILGAGLTVDKSHNHSLALSYVPVGRDAMVSSSADLKFTNNTGSVIYIETGVTDATENKYGSAFVKIYGNKTDIKYKVRSSVTEIPLRDGEIDPARKSVTYVDACKGDTVVNTKTVRRSSYSAVKDKSFVPPQMPMKPTAV